MSDRTTRRRLLATSAGLLAALAGCGLPGGEEGEDGDGGEGGEDGENGEDGGGDEEEEDALGGPRD